LLALTFLIGFFALLASNKVKDRQRLRIAELGKETAEAKTTASDAAARAATAESHLADAKAKAASAETHAAEAKTVAAKAEEETNRQKERAAIAEKALLELRERIQPRRLTAKQRESFVAILARHPGAVIDFGYAYAGGDETFNFAKQFLQAIVGAGWKVRNESGIAAHMDIQVLGVVILVPGPKGSDPRTNPATGPISLTPTLAALRDAFRAIGIEARFTTWTPNDDAIPQVVIGSKPEP
jgi:hypothetical protein